MSSNWLRSAKIVHLSKLALAAQPPAPAIPFDPLTLSTHQQAALLSMRENHAARACVRRLLQDSPDRYGGKEFAALRTHQLAEWKPGYRLHQLTPQGRVAAHELQKTLCKLHGIHVLSQGLDCGATNFVSCSCGSWGTHVSRNIFSGGSAMAAFAKHKRSAEAMAVITTALKPMAVKEESA